MASVKFLQTNQSFALGWVSGEFAGRGDLKTAAFGLSRLENMDVLSSGGIRRRCGTSEIMGGLSEFSRLFSFTKKGGEEFLIILGNNNFKVMKGASEIATGITHWPAAKLSKIQAVQLKDTMIFTHPEFEPYILRSTPNWDLSRMPFASTNDRVYFPWHKFENSNYPFTISNATSGGGSRTALLTSTRSQWAPESMFTNLRFGGIDWWITEYIDPTQVRVTTNNVGATMPTGTVNDWWESPFNDRRGWPRSATVYQNRLVFAGTDSLPNFIWLSKTGEHFNFDSGTGLDNESITASLLGSQQHNIVAVQSGENLEILTDCGEWSAKGAPITPTQISIRQHTNIGSSADAYVPAQRVDGSTIFVSRDFGLRELQLDNLSDSYSATDLSSLSRHLMAQPLGMAYHQSSKRLFIVRNDGNIAVLKKDDNLEILGWSLYRTDGMWKNIAVSDDKVYAVVKRGGQTFLEFFDEAKMTDGAGDFAYAHIAAAQPVFSDGTPARLARLTKWKARVMDSEKLQVRLNGGAVSEVNLPAVPFSGDVSINSLGTENNGEVPLWEITGNTANPLTVLSITIEGRIST